jgi:hypothetical protein
MEAKDETKTLWEELPHKALDNGPGAFQLADGRIAYLAFVRSLSFYFFKILMFYYLFVFTYL